eukprot:TRINITY_DN11841_c0_g1_i3.p1 TRINITY_DN11841_c0_g1~~TRINITY_DN11841_c0_g1_i3.p1  ORF type:complete len:544 (+),score=101.56 TRINITY_DN11841_c0_g1_i3:1358-2989(+)
MITITPVPGFDVAMRHIPATLLTGPAAVRQMVRGRVSRFMSGVWQRLLNCNAQARQTRCLSWYETEKKDMSWLDDIPGCPTTRRQARLAPAFTTDMTCRQTFGGISFNATGLNCAYHPGATACYFSIDGTSRQQCCYVGDGLLPVDHPSAGTTDKSAAFWPHMMDDVWPHEDCCSVPSDNNCNKYFEVRPPDNGTWSPPRPVRTWGDPHLTTLDGRTYAFNGRGEYVVMCTAANHSGNPPTLDALLNDCSPSDPDVNGTVRVHLRFDTPASTSSATVTVAGAAMVPGQDPVLVMMNEGTLQLYLGSDRLSLPAAEAGQQEFFSSVGQVNILARHNASHVTRVVLRFHGASLAFEVVGSMLRVSGSVADSYQSRTVGLWGRYDGNVSNDFQPSSSNVPVVVQSASEEDIFDDFGQTWMIRSALQSAFSRFVSTSPFHFGKHYHPSYRPVFTPPGVSIEKQQAAEAACAGVEDDAMRTACEFDVITTNDVSSEHTMQIVLCIDAYDSTFIYSYHLCQTSAAESSLQLDQEAKNVSKLFSNHCLCS